MPTTSRMKIEWSVNVGQVRSMTSALHSLATEVRSSPGCLSCSVSTDLANRGRVCYIEEWRSDADLRERLQSDGFTPVIALIENAAQPSLIEFALERGTRGVDLLTEVRTVRTHE